jgi:hypothetical protein
MVVCYQLLVFVIHTHTHTDLPFLALPQTYFHTKVRQHGAPRPYGRLNISVRREHVFEDSFHQLRSRSPAEMHMKLSVTFQVGACVGVRV